MNNASINRKSVDKGDYVIVEKRNLAEAQDGDYVISRLNDVNNLKNSRSTKKIGNSYYYPSLYRLYHRFSFQKKMNSILALKVWRLM